MYVTLALVLLGAIGFGVYFSANQWKRIDSNKSEVSQLTETQPSNNSANPENVNSAIISNTNVATPILTLTPTPTPISYAGSYEYSKGDYWGSLKINEIGKTYPKPFKFSFEVGRAGRCAGDISGVAKWTKSNLAVATIKNEMFDTDSSIYNKPNCRITFIFSGSKIKVSEDGCLERHGAECDFEGNYNK